MKQMCLLLIMEQMKIMQFLMMYTMLVTAMVVIAMVDPESPAAPTFLHLIGELPGIPGDENDHFYI